ncbi:MAG: hypothetical protein KDK39_10185 [Leptospiraceae bacterium]|nr:hypothetical protein [Leptospiraceae bacterium]
MRIQTFTVSNLCKAGLGVFSVTGFLMLVMLLLMPVMLPAVPDDDCDKPQTDTGCELQLKQESDQKQGQSDQKNNRQNRKKITTAQWESCKKYVAEHGLAQAGWSQPNHKGDCNDQPGTNYNFQVWPPERGFTPLTCDKRSGICYREYFLVKRIRTQDNREVWDEHTCCQSDLQARYGKMTFSSTDRVFPALPGQYEYPHGQARLYRVSADCSQF